MWIVYLLIGLGGLGTAVLFRDQEPIIQMAGLIVAAVGLIGAGLQLRGEQRSSARRLAEVEAAEKLREREAAEQEEAGRRQSEAEAENLRQAQLRDLERIRRALVAELSRLHPGAVIGFAWGNQQSPEERTYRLVDDEELAMRFKVGSTGAGWVWRPGELPFRKGSGGPAGQVPRRVKAKEREEVQRAYDLFQLERYLVSTHLPGETLEVEATGYKKFLRVRDTDT